MVRDREVSLRRIKCEPVNKAATLAAYPKGVDRCAFERNTRQISTETHSTSYTYTHTKPDVR